MLKPIYWNGLRITSVFSINVVQDEIFHESLVDMLDTPLIPLSSPKVESLHSENEMQGTKKKKKKKQDFKNGLLPFKIETVPIDIF